MYAELFPQSTVAWIVHTLATRMRVTSTRFSLAKSSHFMKRCFDQCSLHFCASAQTNVQEFRHSTKHSLSVIHICSSRHQIAWFKATKDFTPPYRAALSQRNSVVSFATPRVLNCLYSPGLRCSCCNGVRFCCDLEAWILVAAALGRWRFNLWVL
jgi:hypothetical protein